MLTTVFLNSLKSNTKLKRYFDSGMDVCPTVEMLDKQGVKVHCLVLGGVDLTSAAGKMTIGVIAAVAQSLRETCSLSAHDQD